MDGMGVGKKDEMEMSWKLRSSIIRKRYSGLFTLKSSGVDCLCYVGYIPDSIAHYERGGIITPFRLTVLVSSVAF